MVRSPRLRAWIEQLLHTQDTPERTAVAYALGVLLGFSPFLGFHTILGLILAFALRLNRVAVLLGVYTNLPWILVPYYAVATWLGAVIVHADLPPGSVERLLEGLEKRSWAELRLAVVSLKPFLWAFTVGSMLGAAILALIAYRVAFVMVERHRRHLRPSQEPEI